MTYGRYLFYLFESILSNQKDMFQRFYDWIETVDPDNGEPIFFLLDRTAMAVNPLDKKYYNGGAGVSGFLGKFDIDLSNLQIFN